MDPEALRAAITDAPNNTPDTIRPWIVLVAWGAIAAMGCVAFWWASATGLISWAGLQEARRSVGGFVDSQPLVAYSLYVLVFLALALALAPALLWLVALSAFLFGFWPAALLSWFAAMAGAFLVVILARGLLAKSYFKHANRFIEAARMELNRSQLSWLLTLRLLPFIPFSVGNVVAAFLGVRMRPFLLATGIGLAPTMIAYAFAGDRARSAMSSDIPPDPGKLLGDLAPALMIMAALPIIALLARRLIAAKHGAKT